MYANQYILGAGMSACRRPILERDKIQNKTQKSLRTSKSIDMDCLVIYNTGAIYNEVVIMSLPFGLLGLLTYQDSTGYDLAKMFEASLNNFWHAQSSQIYRELNRMQEKGWVTFKSVIQDKRPNKRVYSITEEGRNALKKWINEEPPMFEHPHEPFLMRVFFGSNAPEVTLTLIKTVRDMCLAELDEHFKNIQADINNYTAATPGGEKENLYWRMTMDFGIAQTKATVQWAQECIEKLEGENKS